MEEIRTRYTETSNGYIKLYVVDEYGARVVEEHRYVMENKIGRRLGAAEVVHHIDGNKHNNEISNLEIVGRVHHARHHALKQAPSQIVVECSWCGKQFSLPPSVYRARISRSLSNKLFCSRSCGTKHQHSIS